MSSSVSKLESLLARVQRNRTQPRTEAPVAPAAPVVQVPQASLPAVSAPAPHAPSREVVPSPTPLERALASQTSRPSVPASAPAVDVGRAISSLPPVALDQHPPEPEITVEDPFADEAHTAALGRIEEAPSPKRIEPPAPRVSAPIVRTTGEALRPETFGTLLVRTLSLRPR